MWVYDIARGADFTTHATPGSETGAYRVNAGATRRAFLAAIMCGGKNVDAAALNAIELRIAVFTTGSTAGTSITPAPAQGAPAAAHTAAHSQTLGSVRTDHGGLSFSGTGQGGWVAPDVDSMIGVDGGSGDSIDVISASGKASMAFTCSLQTKE